MHSSNADLALSKSSVINYSTFDITKEFLPDFLRQIYRGRIQLPDLQRSFCWSDEQIRELIASVSQAWPVGAVTLLEMGNPDVTFKPRLVEGVNLEKSPDPSQLILDGQQRSTALWMAMWSNQPVWIKDKKSSKISKRWYYIDIEKALDPNQEREMAIISLSESRLRPGGKNRFINCSSPEKEYELGMFPVSQVFQYPAWRAAYSKYWGYQPAKLELLDRFEVEVIKKFEHYQIPIIQLRTELPKMAVCRVFEKINRISSELNFFDLSTAIYASNDFSLRDDWESRSKRLKKHKVLQGVRNIDWLQAVTLIATYQRRLEAIKLDPLKSKQYHVGCGRKEVLELSLEEYLGVADTAMAGYEAAARFLHGQKTFTPEDIAYPVQLVALACILSITGFPKQPMRSRLEQWWWGGIFGELYSTWQDSRVSRDVLEVPDWLSNGSSLPSTLELAKFSAVRLKRLHRRQGAIYKGLNVLLRSNGAIDFASGEALSDVNFFEDKIQSHHIFPVAWCRNHDIETSKYNCLINRTPLSETTNRLIGGKAPSLYLAKLQQAGISRKRLDTILRSHLIEPDTLWNDDFEGFFAARTEALSKLIAQAMGK